MKLIKEFFSKSNLKTRKMTMKIIKGYFLKFAQVMFKSILSNFTSYFSDFLKSFLNFRFWNCSYFLKETNSFKFVILELFSF